MEKKETFLKIKNTPSLFLQFSRGGQCFCFLISKEIFHFRRNNSLERLSILHSMGPVVLTLHSSLLSYPNQNFFKRLQKITVENVRSSTSYIGT
jgi:hypothetical protein